MLTSCETFLFNFNFNCVQKFFSHSKHFSCVAIYRPVGIAQSVIATGYGLDGRGSILGRSKRHFFLTLEKNYVQKFFSHSKHFSCIAIYRQVGIAQSVIAKGYGLDGRRSILGRGKRLLYFPKRPDQLWSPPIQWMRTAFFLRVKRQGSETDHSLPYS
jgi:hypothetical protein